MRSPLLNQKDYEKKIDAIQLCGKNRGPHDYLPIAWNYTKDPEAKYVTALLCRVCFNRIKMTTIIENFEEVKI